MQPSGFIKTSCAGWIINEIQRQAKRRGIQYWKNVIMGNVDHRLAQWVNNGEDFYYLDHAYFQRGWANNNFRCIRGKLHLTEIKKRPDDRLKKLGIEIEPWRKPRGSKIVVIPTYMTHERIYQGLAAWEGATVSRLKALTDRKVVVKREKGNLREYLSDAWCVVGTGTVATVEAALMGVPVFVTDKDPAWPVNAGPLENIDSPEFHERFEWACSLAYASWNASEIDQINWIDYDYSLCDDLPS